PAAPAPVVRKPDHSPVYSVVRYEDYILELHNNLLVGDYAWPAAAKAVEPLLQGRRIFIVPMSLGPISLDLWPLIEALTGRPQEQLPASLIIWHKHAAFLAALSAQRSFENVLVVLPDEKNIGDHVAWLKNWLLASRYPISLVPRIRFINESELPN